MKDVKDIKLEHLALPPFRDLLLVSSAPHGHLCPRQILGLRMGLAGAKALQLAVPQHDKNLLAIVETDGCFISGVQTATGCAVNRRTMRIEDLGKIAVTFVNVKTEEAIRVAPQPDVRQKAWNYAPKEEKKRYHAMLYGYQLMPEEELLRLEPVKLSRPVGSIISKAGVRVDCANCGEEIINEREVIKDDLILCQSCAGETYYQKLST